MPTTSKISRDKIAQISSLFFSMGRAFGSRAIALQVKKNYCPARHDPSLILRFETLNFIAGQKNPLMREIADHLNIAPPSATSLVNSLVKNHLIKRVPDTKDRRIIRLDITPAGQALIKLAEEHIYTVTAKLLQVLSPKEFEQLTKLLKKILTSHEK